MNLKHCLRPLSTVAVLTLAATAAISQPLAEERSYLNLQVGRSHMSLPNGTGLYGSESTDTSYKVAYGWHVLPYLGGEIGYLDAGKVSRGGGDTKARAASLSVVGRVPVGPLSLFGKGGATYSQTDTSSAPLSGVQAGSASGWAPSYGAGVAMNVLPNMAIVAEWERYKMHFAGIGKQGVENTSVGLRVKF